MKWTVINVLGAAAWLLGLLYTRVATLPQLSLPAAGEHQVLFGAVLGVVGLVTLLWTNLSSTV